jgi:hypothetical protein
MKTQTFEIRTQPQVTFQDNKATETETDTVNVQIQCEEAASTIQEHFRRLLQRNVSKASTGKENKGNPNTFEDGVTAHSSEDEHSYYNEQDSDIEHSRDRKESKSDDDESSSEGKKIDRTELYVNVFVAFSSGALILFSFVSSIIKFCSGKCGHDNIGATDGVDPNLVQNGTSAPPGSQTGGGGNGAAPQPPP